MGIGWGDPPTSVWSYTVTRILLVDDDPSLNTLAQSVFASIRPEWKVEAVFDPREVEQLLRERNFDAVLSDLEMPGIGGIQLLTEIAVAEPLMVRFMMSSRAEIGKEVEAQGIAHRFFAKPCDFRAVIHALERAIALRKRIRSSRLRTVLNSIPALPSPPRTYFAVQQLLASDDFHTGRLLELLKKDMSLCAFILKAANSSFYGSRQPVESVERALSLLGLNTMKSLILGAELFAQIDPRKVKMFAVERLFEHAARVAGIAASLAERTAETKPLKDLAFTAGLLHDIGKIICIHSLGGTYKKIVDKAGSDFQALYHEEIAVLGVSHQEIGAYVLALWGIPDPIVEAAAYHHQPLLAPVREVSVLTFVAAANMLDHGMPGSQSADAPSEVGEYLESLGMNSKDLLV